MSNHHRSGLFAPTDASTWASILLTLPTSTLTSRDLPLGLPTVDERSRGASLPAGSHTLVVGPHGSGRTAVAARAVAAAVRALTGTGRKVIFGIVVDDPYAVMDRLLREGLTLNQLKKHVRVAQVRTVADVACLAATVIADAVRDAAERDVPLENLVPDLVVIDDAGALVPDDAGRNASAVQSVLAELCRRLGDGTFFAEARAAVGTDQDKIRALTGRYASGAGKTGHVISTLVTRRVTFDWAEPSLSDIGHRSYEHADLVLATQVPAGTPDPARRYPEPTVRVLKSRHF